MRKTVKDYLKGILPEDKLEEVNRSFEVIGDIAICEINPELVKFQEQIAQAIMNTNKSIKTVLKKSGIHEGEFRTQKMQYLSGEDKKETVYLENGIRLRLNVETVYFSSKLGTERMQLSQNIKSNSNVLVMFSGCGPYTFNILRQQPDIENITSIEINPEGHKYALKNLELNKNLLKKSYGFQEIIKRKKETGEYINEKEIISKLNEEKIKFINGDVREIVNNDLKNQRFDEIFMPLPKDAELFLDCAFKVASSGAIVHMYDFVHEKEFPQKSENAVKDAAKKFGKAVEIISTRKVGQYSPRKYRVCCDFIVK